MIRDHSKHTFIQYGLLVLVVALLVAVATQLAVLKKDQVRDGTWTCSKTICESYVSVPEWIEKQCKQQGAEIMCAVSVNGEPRQVPLTNINTTYLSAQCAVLRCVEESWVRPSEARMVFNSSSFLLQ